jgi:hypothetical protein
MFQLRENGYTYTAYAALLVLQILFIGTKLYEKTAINPSWILQA